MNQGPKLNEGQHSVLLAEVATGILLTKPGEQERGSEPTFHVFESRAEATAFAERILADHPDIECILFDGAGRLLEEKRDVARFRASREAPRRAGPLTRLWRTLSRRGS